MPTQKAWVSGAAFSVVFGALYVACAVAVVLFPEGTLTLINQWTHGIDLSLIRRSSTITVGQWMSGFISALVFSFCTGTLYGWARNVFARLSAPTVQT